MKSSYLGIFFFLSFELISQDTIVMEPVPYNSSRSKIILVLNQGAFKDTILDCPKHFKIIDYVIKSNDSISIILREQGFHYSYSQIIKNPETGGWEVDSSGLWNSEGSSYRVVDGENIQILYELQDYGNIIKNIGGQIVKMELPLISQQPHAQIKK